MSISKKEIAEFYDRFVDVQTNIAFNERHLLLFEKLKSFGLKTDSRVLELGCGIGVNISLLKKKVKKGEIIGVDISGKSIEKAMKHLSKDKQVKLLVGDIVNLDLKPGKLDFILLFDVLEHIPPVEHNSLFRLLSSLMDEKTSLVINIPSPEYHRYVLEHEADDVQIIDQPLPANQIMNSAYENSLVLDYFETLNIWTEKDYQVMKFSKAYSYKNIPVKQKTGLGRRIPFIK